MPRTGVKRRHFLALSALGTSAIGATQAMPSLVSKAAAGAPYILKPLPADRFIDYGTNAEMRWDSVDPHEYLTSQADLFVRNHVSTPTIEATTYTLKIFGDGLRNPDGVELGLDEIKAFRETTVTTVHECTGNGRSFFTSQQGDTVSGTAWKLGAVGTVRWTGVRLRDVLVAAGIRPDAVSIQATGLDPNYVSGGVDYGPVRRPFPVEKAFDDAILAWAANGETLLPDHGYPLRLVLPGWIGVASTKWLGSLEVSTSEQTSPWNTTWYNIDGPLTVNPVRSAWELAWGAEIKAADEVVLTGRAWSGKAPIATVEVSTDGGSTWAPAALSPRGQVVAGEGHGWTHFSYVWRSPAAGSHELLARATDEAGRTQPDVAAANPNGYFFDAVVRHPVTVV